MTSEVDEAEEGVRAQHGRREGAGARRGWRKDVGAQRGRRGHRRSLRPEEVRRHASRVISRVSQRERM